MDEKDPVLMDVACENEVVTLDSNVVKTDSLPKILSVQTSSSSDGAEGFHLRKELWNYAQSGIWTDTKIICGEDILTVHGAVLADALKDHDLWRKLLLDRCEDESINIILPLDSDKTSVIQDLFYVYNEPSKVKYLKEIIGGGEKTGNKPKILQLVSVGGNKGKPYYVVVPASKPGTASDSPKIIRPAIINQIQPESQVLIPHVDPRLPIISSVPIPPVKPNPPPKKKTSKSSSSAGNTSSYLNIKSIIKRIKAARAKKLETELLRMQRPVEPIPGQPQIVARAPIPKDLTCVTCDRVFKNTQAYEKHVASQKHIRNHPCDSCPKVYKSVSSLKEHKFIHHSNHPDSQAKFPCNICGKKMKRKHLYTHVLIHYPEKWKFKCNKCDEKFMTNRLLNTHKAKDHGETLVCEECGKHFVTDTSLKVHVSNVHGDEKFPCELCGKILGSRLYLSMHLRRHKEGGLDESKKTCDVCGKSVKSRYFYQHMKVHDPASWKFECKYCGKKFQSKFKMVEHTAVSHTGEALFPCPNCGKKFQTTARRSVHKRTCFKHATNEEEEDRSENHDSLYAPLLKDDHFSNLR